VVSASILSEDIVRTGHQGSHQLGLPARANYMKLYMSARRNAALKKLDLLRREAAELIWIEKQRAEFSHIPTGSELVSPLFDVDPFGAPSSLWFPPSRLPFDR